MFLPYIFCCCLYSQHKDTVKVFEYLNRSESWKLAISDYQTFVLSVPNAENTYNLEVEGKVLRQIHQSVLSAIAQRI